MAAVGPCSIVRLRAGICSLICPACIAVNNVLVGKLALLVCYGISPLFCAEIYIKQDAMHMRPVLFYKAPACKWQLHALCSVRLCFPSDLNQPAINVRHKKLFYSLWLFKYLVQILRAPSSLMFVFCPTLNHSRQPIKRQYITEAVRTSSFATVKRM